jgi:hypothetical protein
MPLPRKGFEIPKGKYKFRILVGSHIEGVPVAPHPLVDGGFIMEDVVYRAGEVVETSHNLKKAYDKPGNQGKFEEIPTHLLGAYEDRKRYRDASEYSNDPMNPGEVKPLTSEDLGNLKEQNAQLAAQLRAKDAQDSQRDAKMAEQEQKIAQLMEVLKSKKGEDDEPPKATSHPGHTVPHPGHKPPPEHTKK